MTLVEWTRLEPGQVEAVVAMLINREHPTSVRITPSRGDGGVDILDRGQGSTGGDVVYQVKSYTEGLIQRQKDNIEDSLTTLGTDERWAGLTVEEWRLVTPWDPSPEAENWLYDLGQAAGLTTVWHGLDHVEQLAAKYGDVIDYYLRGGQARIAAAQAEVLSLVGLERVNDQLTVEEVAQRIQQALGVLDHDPHYRFEFRFGQGPFPAPSERPGLVMHSLRGDQAADRWVTIDIIARCAASADVHPITINGTINIERGTSLAEQWEAFVTYGAPVTLPAGSFAGEVNAPAGLGGSLDGAVLRTGPAAHAELGDNPEMYLEVLDPEGHVLASADMERVERSQGIGGGIRAVLRETHGIFTIEDRYNLAETSTSRNLSVSDITGLPVRTARAGVEVVFHLHAPNQLRISTRHTPPERGIIDTNVGFEWEAERSANLGAMLRILETLCEIQAGTDTLLRAPDFTRANSFRTGESPPPYCVAKRSGAYTRWDTA
ncbi:hypothetical protein [Kribbella sp. DT2]|uniref:hypothetical protein n=1 Tax=Kribbella sp. DT2 TaxID=3393427 RepID=UPI003CF62766